GNTIANSPYRGMQILGSSNKITLNSLANDGTADSDDGGHGLLVGSTGVGNAVGNQVSGNTAVANGGDGVRVTEATAGTTVSGNLASANNGSGVFLDPALAGGKSNVAEGNGDPCSPTTVCV